MKWSYSLNKIIYNKKICKYLKQLPIASNMFAPVPMLHIGISINHVTALVISGSNTFTSIASVFSPPWSLPSSVSNKNLWLWQSWTTFASRRGANAFFTIMVVFIRPDVNFPTISLSGNNWLANFVKWSANENGRLYSATNYANFCIHIQQVVALLRDISIEKWSGHWKTVPT